MKSMQKSASYRAWNVFITHKITQYLCVNVFILQKQKVWIIDQFLTNKSFSLKHNHIDRIFNLLILYRAY